MRDLFISLFLATSFLPIGAGIVKISESLVAEDTPHVFAGLDVEPLWSPDIKRVDPNLQSYERLPAIQAADAMVAETKPAQRANATADGGQSPEKQVGTDDDLAEFRTVKTREWCGARYRSYDPADNSYQPYGGGPRRVCLPPMGIAPGATQSASASVTSQPDANARWCMERYSSYRVEDNSYQPFRGARKQCSGPNTQSASNLVRATANSSVVEF